MSLQLRIAAIVSAPPLGLLGKLRTSKAFAARFVADASRSGLTLDLQEPDGAALVRICPTCGAQNGRNVAECFNCQTELTAADRPRAPATAARPSASSTARELRFSLIAASPRASTLPLVKVPLVRARFAAQLQPVKPIDTRSVADRFLSVFVEREQRQAPTVAVGRFDQRTVLDKFLSVFIERE